MTVQGPEDPPAIVEPFEDPGPGVESVWDDEPASATPVNGHHVRIDDRPEVRIGKDMHRVVEEISEALAKDPLCYQRSHRLITVVGTPRKVNGAVVARVPTIRELESSSLLLRMTRHVKMLAYKEPSDTAIKKAQLAGKDINRWQEVLPSDTIRLATLAAGEWPAIRDLVGVTEAPILRRDGTIVQDAGYDLATEHLYLPSADYPRIADEPTQDEARAALERLEALFADFPHVSRAHRMVPIAAILTILARSAIDGAVPAFLFDASTRGSGKSLQCDVVAAVATGKSAARLGYPDTEDELEKILSASAIGGDRLLCIDNVNRPFGGGHIDRVITARDFVKLRVLGRSEMRELRWVAVLLASGNNLTLFGDTSRRVLIARLESDLEDPEGRTDFRIQENLVTYALAHRAELVADGLTILRAYTAKGCPDAGCARWGSFEAWARLVPHAIVFAGGEDVMGAKPRSDAQMDDDARAYATVLDALPRLTHNPITIRDLVKLLWPDGQAPKVPDGHDDLRDALEVFAPPPRPGMPPHTKRLGDRLRRFVGRVVSGRKLARGGVASNKSQTYRVESV